MKRKMGILFVVVVCTFISVLLEIHGQCVFPQHLSGDWIGADRGLVTFTNSSFVTSYRTSEETVTLPDTLNFTCYENQENIYVLKSTFTFLFASYNIEIFLCLEIFVHNINVAYYYQLTDYNPFIRDSLYGDGSGNATLNEICSLSPSPKSFVSVVRNGQISQVNMTCPSEVVAVYNNVTVQHHGNPISYSCVGTHLDGCTDRTSIQINYSGTCANTPTAKTLSDSGAYICLQSLTDGEETFLSVWNTDREVNNPFSCWAMKRQENNTYITETPVHCNDNSSTMETLVGGVSIIITDIEDACDVNSRTTTVASAQQYSTASGLLGLWVLVSLPVLFIILVIAYLIIRYRAAKRRPRQGHLDLFGSTSTIHVDVVSKTKFDPCKIRANRGVRVQKKMAIPNWTLFDPKSSPRSVLYLQPKVSPLYRDVFDD